jgi:hypothetical protein
MKGLGFIIHYGLRAGLEKKKNVYSVYLYKFMLSKLGFKSEHSFTSAKS